MNIEKMLLNNSRKAMLDNIQALDKKTLQKELKEHLQKEFQFYDELQRKDNIIKDIKKLCDEYDTKMHLDDTIYIDDEFLKKLTYIIKDNKNEK